MKTFCPSLVLVVAMLVTSALLVAQQSSARRRYNSYGYNEPYQIIPPPPLPSPAPPPMPPPRPRPTQQCPPPTNRAYQPVCDDQGNTHANEDYFKWQICIDVAYRGMVTVPKIVKKEACWKPKPRGRTPQMELLDLPRPCG